MNDVHAPNSQNSGDGKFRTPIHAEIPDQRHRQEANGQVGHGGADAIQVCDADEQVCIDTGAL